MQLFFPSLSLFFYVSLDPYIMCNHIYKYTNYCYTFWFQCFFFFLFFLFLLIVVSLLSYLFLIVCNNNCLRFVVVVIVVFFVFFSFIIGQSIVTLNNMHFVSLSNIGTPQTMHRCLRIVENKSRSTKKKVNDNHNINDNKFA